MHFAPNSTFLQIAIKRQFLNAPLQHLHYKTQNCVLKQSYKMILIR